MTILTTTVIVMKIRVIVRLRKSQNRKRNPPVTNLVLRLGRSNSRGINSSPFLRVFDIHIVDLFILVMWLLSIFKYYWKLIMSDILLKFLCSFLCSFLCWFLEHALENLSFIIIVHHILYERVIKELLNRGPFGWILLKTFTHKNSKFKWRRLRKCRWILTHNHIHGLEWLQSQILRLAIDQFRNNNS